MTVPMTYCFDIVHKGIHFSPVSLGGAVIVFVSFILLNLHEQHTNSASAKKKKARAAQLQVRVLRADVCWSLTCGSLIQACFWSSFGADSPANLLTVFQNRSVFPSFLSKMHKKRGNLCIFLLKIAEKDGKTAQAEHADEANSLLEAASPRSVLQGTQHLFTLNFLP